MKQVVVDNDFHKTIMEIWQTTELHDTQGRIIGKFVPDLDAFLRRIGIDPAELDAVAMERRQRSQQNAQRIRNENGQRANAQGDRPCLPDKVND